MYWSHRCVYACICEQMRPLTKMCSLQITQISNSIAILKSYLRSDHFDEKQTNTKVKDCGSWRRERGRLLLLYHDSGVRSGVGVGKYPQPSLSQGNSPWVDPRVPLEKELLSDVPLLFSPVEFFKFGWLLSRFLFYYM